MQLSRACGAHTCAMQDGSTPFDCVHFSFVSRRIPVLHTRFNPGKLHFAITCSPPHGREIGTRRHRTVQDALLGTSSRLLHDLVTINLAQGRWLVYFVLHEQVSVLHGFVVVFVWTFAVLMESGTARTLAPMIPTGRLFHRKIPRFGGRSTLDFVQPQSWCWTASKNNSAQSLVRSCFSLW